MSSVTPADDEAIPTLYEFDQVAQLLGVSKSTLWAKTGGDTPLWPSLKIGKRRLFRQQEINEILALSRTDAVPATPRLPTRAQVRRETVARARSGMRSVG